MFTAIRLECLITVVGKGLFHSYHWLLAANAFRGLPAFAFIDAPRLSNGGADLLRAPRAPLLKGIIPKVHKVSSERFSSQISMSEQLKRLGPLTGFGV